jgi:hypothetical protein
MQTYKLDTYISEDGMITLPTMPFLYNKKVRLVITPIAGENDDVEKRESHDAMDFVRKYSGSLKGLSKSDTEDTRYEYLMKKYNINNSFVSESDLEETQYKYLKKKYQ